MDSAYYNCPSACNDSHHEEKNPQMKEKYRNPPSIEDKMSIIEASKQPFLKQSMISKTLKKEDEIGKKEETTEKNYQNDSIQHDSSEQTDSSFKNYSIKEEVCPKSDPTKSQEVDHLMPPLPQSSQQQTSTPDFVPYGLKKRRNLTLEDKLFIIESSKSPFFNQSEIARQFDVSQAAVSRIMKKKEAILRFANRVHSSALVKKSMRHGKIHDTENKLFDWIHEQWVNGQPITGPLVKAQAKEIHRESSLDFKFSEGWLNRFKGRYGLGFKGTTLANDCPALGNWLEHGYSKLEEPPENAYSMIHCDMPLEGPSHFLSTDYDTKIDDDATEASLKAEATGEDPKELQNPSSEQKDEKSKPRKRKILSLEDKLFIIDVSKTPLFNQQGIAKEFGVTQSMVSRTLKRKDAIIQFAKDNPKNIIRKRVSYGAIHETEKKLFEWICEECPKGQPIDGGILRSKARDLHAGLSDFKFSDGWLHGFKRRFNVQYKDGAILEQCLIREQNRVLPVMKTESCDETEFVEASQEDTNFIDDDRDNEHEDDKQSPKRKCLSLVDKLHIIEASTSPNFNQSEIAGQFGVSQSAISRILKNQKALLEFSNEVSLSAKKSMRVGQIYETEKKLYDWMWLQKQSGHKFNSVNVRSKAKEFHGESGDFKFSDGWLNGFKRRFGFTFRGGFDPGGPREDIESYLESNPDLVHDRDFDDTYDALDNYDEIFEPIEEDETCGVNIGLRKERVKPERDFLTLDEKVLVTEASESALFNQSEVARQFGVSKSLILKTLKNRELLLGYKLNGHASIKKPLKQSRKHETEKKLFEWYIEQKELSARVNGPMMREKAKEIHGDVDDFQFTEGWLDAFKKRFNINFTGVKRPKKDHSEDFVLEPGPSNVKQEFSDQPPLECVIGDEPSIPKVHKPRKHLSLEEKMYVIQASKSKAFNQKILAEQYGVTQSAISRIIKKKEELYQFVNGGSQTTLKKSMRRSKVHDTEEKLYEWIHEQWIKGLPITGPLVRAKAKEMHGVDAEIKFSEGWLNAFKERYDLRFHGKSLSNDCSTVGKWLAEGLLDNPPENDASLMQPGNFYEN